MTKMKTTREESLNSSVGEARGCLLSILPLCPVVTECLHHARSRVGEAALREGRP